MLFTGAPENMQLLLSACARDDSICIIVCQHHRTWAIVVAAARIISAVRLSRTTGRAMLASWPKTPFLLNLRHGMWAMRQSVHTQNSFDNVSRLCEQFCIFDCVGESMQIMIAARGPALLVQILQ